MTSKCRAATALVATPDAGPTIAKSTVFDAFAATFALLERLPGKSGDLARGALSTVLLDAGLLLEFVEDDIASKPTPLVVQDFADRFRQALNSGVLGALEQKNGTAPGPNRENRESDFIPMERS